MPANPSPCYGVSSGCCPGVALPDIVLATFENVSTCPCIAGMTVALNYNPMFGAWEGIGPGGGGCSLRGENFRLSCGGTDCSSFLFQIFGGSCVTGSMTLESCSCSPFSVVFLAVLTGLGCCDSMFGSGTVRITISG